MSPDTWCVALGGLPLEELVVVRATPFPFPGNIPLLTCSAEDLCRSSGVRRAWAGLGRRGGIIVRQAGALDWPYIDEHLGPLAAPKEAPEILTGLGKLRAEFER